MWVLSDTEPTPIEVATGQSDGRVTQVTGGSLQAGTAVIVDTTEPVR